MLPLEELETLLRGDLLEAADAEIRVTATQRRDGAQDHIDERAAKDALEVHGLLGLEPASSFSEL